MRRWMGIGLAIICILGLGLSWLPVPAVLDRYQGSQPAWWLNIWKPLFLRVGEEGKLSAEVHPPSGEGVTARLDLPGLVYGDSQAGEGLGTDGNAHFSWQLNGAQAGIYRGRLWLFISGRDEPLMARPVEVRVLGPNATLLWFLRVVMLGGLFESGLSLWFSRKRRPIQAGKL